METINYISAPDNYPINSMRKRVLVIDSNPYSKIGFKKEISSWGYLADVSESLDDAIRKLAYIKYDLVIIDILTEHDSLFDFPGLARKNVLNESTPIAAKSAINNKDFIIKLFKNQYNDYILKPFDCDYLKEKINFLCQNSSHPMNSHYAVPINKFITSSFGILVSTVNEFGVHGYTDVNFPLGMVLQVNLDQEFTEADGPFSVRIIKVESGNHDFFKYQFEAEFIDMSPKKSREIRKRYILHLSRN